MTLDEAVARLESRECEEWPKGVEQDYEKWVKGLEECAEACSLGKEALKRIREARKRNYAWSMPLLPGETKE